MPSAIDEIGESLVRGSNASREHGLARLTELFLIHGERLEEEQVARLDGVMTRLAPLVAVPSRAEMAERLGGLATAPTGILRTLALDDAIVVARPVLVRSERLGDQDLMTAALEKGRDHRLAICERCVLSESVADILLVAPDPEVGRALARNRGARLSPLGAATLIERSRADVTLQTLMGGRPDLPRHLSAALHAVGRDRGARLDTPAAAPPAAAQEAVRGRGETELAEAAGMRRTEDVERLFTELTGLARAVAQQLLREPGNDLLLVAGKAMGWSWITMRALLAFRDPSLTRRHHFAAPEAVFDATTSATAERVLRFLARTGSGIRSA